MDKRADVAAVRTSASVPLRPETQRVSRSGNADVNQLQAEIAEIRHETVRTIDELERRLSPSRLKVEPYLIRRKERLADQLHEAAGALRETETRLKHPFNSELARTSARKIEALGGYLSTRGIDDLIVDLQRFSRARPWLVMAGAFVAGIAVSRFLKASARENLSRTSGRRADF